MKIMSETLWSNFRQVTSKNSAPYTQKAKRIERPEKTAQWDGST